MAKARKPRRKVVRRKPKRGASVEFVAQVVADSDVLGTAEAAKKHGISERTVARYREHRSPDVAARVREKAAVVADAMRDETIASLRIIRDRMVVLAQSADADLYKVTGAFKVLSDWVSADSVTKQILGDPDAEPAEVEAPVPLRMVRGGA